MSEKRVSELAESLVDFCNALESLAVNLRRQIQPLTKTEARAQLSELTFNVLKWQDEKGVRLGSFQVAYKNMNLQDKWLHCYNILKANSSVINNPFKEEGYVYRYWIYPEKYTDRIFRKKLNEAKG
mgnify:CR=1 FL=1